MSVTSSIGGLKTLIQSNTKRWCFSARMGGCLPSLVTSDVEQKLEMSCSRPHRICVYVVDEMNSRSPWGYDAMPLTKMQLCSRLC